MRCSTPKSIFLRNTLSTDGYLMIKAEDFIKRIEEMPLDYIRDWLDGKNQLEWEGVAKTT